MLTIEHSGASGDMVPRAFEAAFDSLSKHAALEVLVLRGCYPVSVYYKLAGLLQDPERLAMLQRLELQQGEALEKEPARRAAAELLVHVAKMRAYSSSQVGLSVVADFAA
jgi:hypothetical protein